MRPRLLTVGRALGAAALATSTIVSTLVVTAGAAHAVATGDLVVSVVDQYGRPVAGVLEAFSAPSGNPAVETNPTPTPYYFGSTHTYLGVDAGGYALEGFTPWSGLDCAGVVPCTVAAPPGAWVPVVTVPAGGTVTYTMHVTLPTVTGTAAVGSPLTLAYGAGYGAMNSYYGIFGGGGTVTSQWSRAGADIAGATASSYTPVPADSAKQLSVRLMPSQGQQLIFASYGGTVEPYTTQPVTVAAFKPAKTKTTLQVPRSIQVGSRVSMQVKIKSKSALGGKPEGQVTVTIGQLKIQKKIKSGKVFISLPNLKAGSYDIAVAYSGSDYFAKSKGKTSITVHG